MSTASGKALDTYREETRKCVLVCANCHCEIEAGLVGSPPAGARFEDWTHHYVSPERLDVGWSYSEDDEQLTL